MILPVNDGSGFHVGVTGEDGARQTILGFQSQAEAEAWILQDKRLHSDYDRFGVAAMTAETVTPVP